MTSITNRLVNGPETYLVNAYVDGGLLVEPDGTTGKIKPCTAGSVRFLGVSMTKAVPAGTSASSTTSYGEPLTDTSQPTDDLAVITTGVVKMTFAANCAFGQRVVAAANGTVTPAAVPVADAAGVVGICVEPAGVTIGTNAKGYVRLV